MVRYIKHREKEQNNVLDLGGSVKLDPYHSPL